MMKHYFLNKLLLYESDNSVHKGFTLIELLVVVIILGILAAIAIPNLLGNIGKARETEATSNLGALSRSQQAYHFETREFASDINSLDQSISIVSKYYNFPDPAIANDVIVKQQAVAIAPWSNALRNYAFGIYHNAGNFDSVFCRGKGILEIVEAPNTVGAPCSNNGVQIR